MADKKTPAYLREDYPYKAKGAKITDLSALTPAGVLYEIKCATPDCELCARTQGVNIPDLLKKLTADGCPACKGKDFELREVDI